MTPTEEINRQAASIANHAREIRSGELSRLQAARTLDEIARAATRIVQISEH
jgi:hypothetical protein